MTPTLHLWCSLLIILNQYFELFFSRWLLLIRKTKTAELCLIFSQFALLYKIFQSFFGWIVILQKFLTIVMWLLTKKSNCKTLIVFVNLYLCLLIFPEDSLFEQLGPFLIPAYLSFVFLGLKRTYFSRIHYLSEHYLIRLLNLEVFV